MKPIRIALLLASTAASLIVGEALLRWLDLPRFDACEATADYAVADAELGFRGAAGGAVGEVVLNSMGLRGPLPSSPRFADTRRLLFLGDSTCWGLGVLLEESFGATAAAAVGAARRGQRVEFVLGAFPGYSSYQSALLLDRLLPLEPDVAILYVGARNDGSRARYYADSEIPARSARREAGWHELRILRGLEALVDGSYRSFFRKLLPAAAQARVPPDAFRTNLERMASRLRDAGVPGLIVLPPLSASFVAEHPESRLYREHLVEVAAANGLATVSVDAAFAAEDERTLFFEDDYHLTARGHAIVAEEIARALLGDGLLR